MKASYLCVVISILVGISPCIVHGQGKRADYERARTFAERTRNTVFRDHVRPHWNSDGTSFWYQVDTGPQQHEFVRVQVASGDRRIAFDHVKLAELLQVQGVVVTPDQLPLSDLSWETEERFSFRLLGERWEWNQQTNQLGRLDAKEESFDSLDNALQELRPSRDGGEESELQFVNETEHRLRLFWINGTGKRIEYGVLAPRERRSQHTFVDHVWLVTDEEGRSVSAFIAINRSSEARIRSVVPRDLSKKGDQAVREDEPRRRGAISPNGAWSAFIRDHNLWIRAIKTTEPESSANRPRETEFPLSHSGTDGDPYVERFVWSPDSRYLVSIQEKVGVNREIHIVESSPQDQVQPKLQTHTYAKPGDVLPIPRPRLFDVEHGQQIPIDESLFPNAWEISDVRWQPNSHRFTFLYNQRGHQVLRLVVVDAKTGEAAALVEEQSPTFIDYAHKSFIHYADASHELIWMSERDGWNHLFLIDSLTGHVKENLTQGDWIVRKVERVDEQKRQVWFTASGVYPEQDPYYVHYGRVDFDGSHLIWLTEGNGHHEVIFSPDGKYLIDRYSRVDLPPVTELRRTNDGQKVCDLERADWTKLQLTGWKTPTRFSAKGRDGQTDIYGIIDWPSNFSEEKKYPVIEKIYAGPQGSFVPKTFQTYRREQELAELGFVVVQIDGMGTSHRSKAFHDICHKNLADAGFPDRIRWLQAAAQSFPQLDLTRVGIYGGSAGGQNALRGLLAHGDIYHVGVADCGCHDNRMDKVWWNELWMGWPLGPHYEAQSNVTQAHRLQGKLLLTVGELDTNVDPASTMQVVHALIQADKDFDLLVVPGAGHGAGESPYGQRRRQDFFVRHLWGIEPRSE